MKIKESGTWGKKSVGGEVCRNCGMAQSEWKGNQGQGWWMSEGEPYCCEGCARTRGCTCADDNA